MLKVMGQPAICSRSWKSQKGVRLESGARAFKLHLLRERVGYAVKMSEKRLTVVLIGPPASGKSTLAPLLAQQLGLEQVQLDEIRWAYYDEIGFDHAHAAELSRAGDLLAMYHYCKPFEIHALERVLIEHAGAVIELGGGHSVHEDPALLERARLALLAIPYVVLLMPSSDMSQSLEVLRARTLQKAPKEGWEPSEEVLELFDHLARHPSNALLAKQRTYTLGRTPLESVQEILKLVRPQ